MSAFGGSDTHIDITCVFGFADLLPPRLPPWPNLPAIRQVLAADAPRPFRQRCLFARAA
jgi:hypothetical protein